ncbi:phosphopantothenoylcysteine decarboxylase [Kiritimatiella glycovorans]|uniref:DNA/pantothenate metabolism flavoprotein n=1 Tax=Kiritimatiella glycovorans TaxID=1307763 RepID=A0A0G3ECI6_9BACT|nr:phosphopantothenoylcysteine decarboxylase [Kiritimatiella glycovorans]AKJ64013.1 DNA/pantothenate metabolism flavoprotein [Kiritimatiella glycovorans]
MSPRVLIFSGPTREHLDPVRFLSNASSGRMGRELALESLRRGAKVDFVTGPVDPARLPAGESLTLHRVTSAREMLERGRVLFRSCDAALFAAAVADYEPAECRDRKMPKSECTLTLEFHPTPDVAATLCRSKRAGQWTLGFALQSDSGREQARDKMQRKHLDAILLNTPAAMERDTLTCALLTAADGTFDDWGTISKTECARRIVSAIPHFSCEK